MRITAVPVPGSRHAVEAGLVTDRNQVLLLKASAIGHSLTLVSQDALGGLHRILGDETLVYSAWPVARQVLESMAIVSWLLDPTKDTTTRIQRMLGYWQENLKQQEFYAKNVQQDYEPATVAERESESARIDQERARLATFARNFKPAPFRITAVVREFGAADDYSVFSGISHGYDWAISQVRQNRLRSPQDHWLFMWQVTVAPQLWFAHGLWALVNYQSPPEGIERMRSLLDQMGDDLGINEQMYFWRR